METNKYLFFYGHKKNKLGTEIYSQWYPCIFIEKICDGVEIKYYNAEQYMMANKALLFGDGDILSKILDEKNPSKIKSLGRKIQNFNNDYWDKYKYDIVVSGNRLKFEQNPKLMEQLQNTGNKILVEASPYDKIWGIGLTANQAIKISESKWPGENLLGKALMQVRKESQ
ncbi:hypothetical protein QKC54_gp0719 [Megavirus baoshan]|uniref:NADAR domain-containing protein n=1 Tax=Megavirus baoshan TaxID=2496520 RepID=A0A3S8UWI9_9VIRU|nr:hypothetical protein QKC54_gp0719 [Megavirus baoshan]AZL89123.1 hypothetical protein Mb0353 [Megavirus baoshan]